MNLNDLPQKTAHAILKASGDLPRDAYHNPIVDAAEYMVCEGADVGQSRAFWEYVTSYSSGASLWRSPDGTKTLLYSREVSPLSGALVRHVTEEPVE